MSPTVSTEKPVPVPESLKLLERTGADVVAAGAATLLIAPSEFIFRLPLAAQLLTVLPQSFV